MLVRVAIAVVLLAVAVAVAAWLDRRRSHEPPSQGRAHVPMQLDRADFPRPDAQWLAVLFSSSECDSCLAMAPRVRALESPEVAVCEVEFFASRALHARYQIDGVPIVVLVDAEGVTRASFTGSVTATDLWAAVAEARSGGG